MAAARPSSGRRPLNLNHHQYQFVDYRASVAQQRGAAHQGNSSRRKSRLQCDTACQTEPTLALSLLVDYVAQSTLHEANTQDPFVEAMHAVLAFQRSTAVRPEPDLSQPAEGSIRNDSAAPQDKRPSSVSKVEQRSTEGAPAGLPDSVVQRSTLSHLYDDMSQVLQLSWSGQDTQSTAKALMWEGREILTGLWLARSQHDILLRNAHLACSVSEKRRHTAEIQAQSSLSQLTALVAQNKKSEADLGKALFGKSQIQKELDKAFHRNVVLAERVNTLCKDLQKARHDIINHPALLRCQKEQDIRRAMEAECNAALRKITAMSNFNLECHAWKRRVLAANEVRGEELARREQELQTCEESLRNRMSSFKHSVQEASVFKEESASHMSEVTELRKQVCSLEGKCKSLEAKIEGDAVRYQEGAEALSATMKQNLKLESERKDLSGRTRHAEGAHSALGQWNEVLEQQVQDCLLREQQMALAVRNLQEQNAMLGTQVAGLQQLRQQDGQAITSSRQAKQLHSHLRDVERACAHCTLLQGRSVAT